jgi:flagellar biosynthesis/type III secretory pathway protein FliH
LSYLFALSLTVKKVKKSWKFKNPYYNNCELYLFCVVVAVLSVHPNWSRGVKHYGKEDCKETGSKEEDGQEEGQEEGHKEESQEEGHKEEGQEKGQEEGQEKGQEKDRQETHQKKIAARH